MSRASRRFWMAGPLAVAASAGIAALSPGARDVAKEHLRALAFHAAWRPAPAGTHAVGFTTITPDIGGADGRIAVDLWYPAEPVPPGLAARLDRAGAALARPTLAPAKRDAAPLAARAPVVLYQPSWFSQRRENSFMLADLASRGFLAVALDDFVHYPGARGPEAPLRAAALDYASDAALQPSLGTAAARSQAAARLASAVLDAIAADPIWGGRADLSRVGVLGFSFGGAVAAEMARADRRVAGAINLDGSTFGEVGERGVQRPYLALFGGSAFPPMRDLSNPDPAIRLDARLTLLESEREAARAGRVGRWCFVFDDAIHLDFCDRLVMPPFAALREARDLDRQRLWTAINAYVASFLEHVLRGGDPQLLLATPLPGVKTVLQARVLAGPRPSVLG